jgi:hydrogenase nickel incorporation protein HypB
MAMFHAIAMRWRAEGRMNRAPVNDECAEENRQLLRQNRMAAVSVVGPVGCGKTTLISATLRRLPENLRVTIPLDNPAAEYEAGLLANARARSIRSHTDRIDASWLGRVLNCGQLAGTDLVMIEQTPTASRGCMELGQTACVAVFSAAAGSEALGRCPLLIQCAKLILVTKSDMIPAVRFDRRAFRAEVRRVNPSVQVLEVSSASGQGIDSWIDWLGRQVAEARQAASLEPLSPVQDTVAQMPSGISTLDRSRFFL